MYIFEKKKEKSQIFPVHGTSQYHQAISTGEMKNIKH